MPERNPILQAISAWFHRNFSDPAAISLFFTLVLGVFFLSFFGKLLLPVLVSVVIAYLLFGIVKMLERWHFPHLLAVIIVFIFALSIVALIIFTLIPLLAKQLYNLMNELPSVFSHSQLWLLEWQKKYPKIFTEIQPQNMIDFLHQHLVSIGQIALRYSLITIPSVIQVVLYFILVPLLVFFFLKDARVILDWFSQYMPSHRSLVLNVWSEVNKKIGAYVRGRALEIIIISIVTMVAFALLKLQYAILLGALVGLSVIIPYIGAVIVTIPIVIIALTQWGFSAEFFYLLVAYGLIILLDANILVPYLFSEAMALHPVVIILSVVIFGSIWGFWGVFFAIPLATLINAILRAWPRSQSITLNKQ